MKPFGFQLETLCVTNHQKPPAVIDFRAGLNVISGSSNTGKSYVLQCINFMLGGSMPPKSIEEAKGYNLAFLAIRPLAGEPLTFERSLKGGAFRVFAGGIDVVSRTEGRIISEQHDADSDDNISSMLLKLSGLNRKTISKNQSGGTRSLSFRDVVKLVLVNETRIFVEGSPILSEKLYWSPEKSTFKLLLTGEDSSSVIVAPTSETVRAQRQGQLELVDELIANSETELAALTTDAVGVEDQAQRASNAIDQLTQSLAENQAELSHQEAVRRSSYATIQELDSKRIAIQELRSRFSLLRLRYISDIERLNSIREANRLFFELSPQPCPVCGADGRPLESVPQEQIDKACETESSKIRVLLRDLTQTMKQLVEERFELIAQRNNHVSAYNSASTYIQKELLPVARKSKGEIDELIGTRQRLECAKQVINQLTLLKEKRATLSPALPKRPKLTTPMEVKVNEFEGLCREIEALLTAWHYPDVGPVRFSESNQDIVIKDRERKNPGKGFRALSHAAFVIGLMKFCRKNNLPHPGFVVLDSPLVAYKDPEAGDENITRSEVKEAFYRSLATTPQDEQIIILENQNPPPDVQGSINWIHFTRTRGVNRYGFFPF